MFVDSVRQCAGLLLVVCCATVFALPTGCKGCGDEEQGKGAAAVPGPALRIPVSIRLSAQEVKLLTKLESKLRQGRIPGRFTREKRKHAKLFVYAAARNEDPKLVATALDGMRKVYRAGGAQRGPQADDNYGLVVATHLESTNPMIQTAAIRAAGRVLARSKPYRPVLDELASIVESHPEPGARIAALDTLRRAGKFGKQKAIASAVQRALEHKDPAVVASALLLARLLRGLKPPLRTEMLKRAETLLKHKDPAVRGRATRLTARLRKGDPKAYDLLAPLLEDKRPLVRGLTALALADLGDPWAIHRLVELLDDDESDQHKLPYRSLDGQPATVNAGRKSVTVSDRTVRAVVRLSHLTDSPLKLDTREAAKPGRGHEKKAARIKAWYAKHKDELPKEPGSVAAKPSPDKKAEQKDKSGAKGKSTGAPKRKAAPAASAKAAPAPAKPEAAE
jgi:hypothetical protein